MKRALRLKAPGAQQLQLQAAKKTEELKADGVGRVLIVYERAGSNKAGSNTCSVYQEQHPKN